MNTALKIIAGLVVAPFGLGFLGMGLAWAFSCTGMDYISKCSVPAVTPIVSGLVSMFWLAAFAIPIGAVCLILLFVVSLISGLSKPTKNDGQSETPK